MHKLFITDIILVFITFLGGVYLYNTTAYTVNYLNFILVLYVFAKTMGYVILPYPLFQKFIDKLTENSKAGYLSGYEIFKGSLVFLLYVGALFLHPGVWVIESILVVIMRVWGKMYIQNLSKL